MATQTSGKNEHTQRRLEQVAHHMNASGRPGVIEKHPDDIVVTAALRTAITKGGKGGFKDTAGADLLVGAFKSLLERSGMTNFNASAVGNGTTAGNNIPAQSGLRLASEV